MAFALLFWLVSANVVAYVMIQVARPSLRRLLSGSWMFHLFSAFAQVWLTREVWRGGDMLGYQQLGERIGMLGAYDPRIWSESLRLMLQLQVHHMPFDVLAGTPTGSMIGLSVFAMQMAGGSLSAVCIIFALVNFMAKLLVVQALVLELPTVNPRTICIAMMWVPSVVFWTCSLSKEAAAMSGMCVGLAAVLRYRRGGNFFQLIVVAFAMSWVALFKPYMLFALLVGCGVYLYALRNRGQAVSPFWLLFFALLTVGALVGLGRQFPRFSFEHLAAEADHLQSARVVGGSNFTLGVERGGLATKFLYAPFALLTTLFRPAIFEIRNAVQAIGGVETAFATYLTFSAARRTGLPAAAAKLLATPFLFASLSFVLVFGVAVGLSTTNLGTLVRYRVPMVPFWYLILEIFRQKRVNSR